ncbi:hypothetical protein ACVWYH_003328 [Bradyrhizobium sp. GM24.11]
MADTSHEFLINFFVNYLPFTPTARQVDDFKQDLSLVSPYLMEASLVEVKNGTLGKKLSQGKDWRPAIFQVYNRKVAEHAQLFPIFHSFETAFRSTVAVKLEEHYGETIWWNEINNRIRAHQNPRDVRTIGSQPITRDTANAIAQLIYSLDGAELTRDIVSSCENGFQFLECCELAQVSRLIEEHWALFAPIFNRNRNRLSVSHFKRKFKAVREARNDIYHHKSVARMTGVVYHAEDLLDYLGFSLRFVFDKILDAVPQEPRFLIRIEKKHRTW